MTQFLLTPPHAFFYCCQRFLFAFPVSFDLPTVEIYSSYQVGAIWWKFIWIRSYVSATFCGSYAGRYAHCFSFAWGSQNPFHNSQPFLSVIFCCVPCRVSSSAVRASGCATLQLSSCLLSFSVTASVPCGSKPLNLVTPRSHNSRHFPSVNIEIATLQFAYCLLFRWTANQLWWFSSWWSWLAQEMHCYGLWVEPTLNSYSNFHVGWLTVEWFPFIPTSDRESDWWKLQSWFGSFWISPSDIELFSVVSTIIKFVPATLLQLSPTKPMYRLPTTEYTHMCCMPIF